VADVTVWVSDADGALGARVCERLAGLGTRIVATPGDADVVIWLTAHDAAVRASWHRASLGDLGAVLDRATARHIVMVSSAMVYGAWPNNPVPLTEDAVLRPEFDYAVHLVEVEQLVERWRQDSPGRSATVLRPAVAMAADAASGLAAALAAGMGERFGEADPPAQFLHLDDLADAVVLCAMRRIDGVRNAAPDGFVPGERLRALTGSPPRLQLPSRWREVVTGLRWRLERGPIPPGLVAYTRWPWVVSNDRLVADGWQPAITNEQAYVEGTEAKWWTMVSPKRRQEAALAAAGTLLAIVLAVAGRALRSAAVTAATVVPPTRR